MIHPPHLQCQREPVPGASVGSRRACVTQCELAHHGAHPCATAHARVPWCELVPAAVCSKGVPGGTALANEGRNEARWALSWTPLQDVLLAVACRWLPCRPAEPAPLCLVKPVLSVGCPGEALCPSGSGRGAGSLSPCKSISPQAAALPKAWLPEQTRQDEPRRAAPHYTARTRLSELGQADLAKASGTAAPPAPGCAGAAFVGTPPRARQPGTFLPDLWRQDLLA